MPTISAKVSKKELDAIQEYANARGETVSNLIRKTLIRSISFMDFTDDQLEYRCEINIPQNITSEEETELVKGTYDKVRRILEIPELKEI